MGSFLDVEPISDLIIPPSLSTPPYLPPTSPFFSQWLLRPDKVHLDHGSSGGCPRSIFAAQTAFRLRIELGSPDFFLRHFHATLHASKAALAQFLQWPPTNLALMPGTTHAMNAVLHSHHFAPGDELLTTSHAYASTFTLLHAIAARDNATVTTAHIPLFPTSPEQVLDCVLAAVTPKTRFALIDHIPSRAALIYPLPAILSALEARGIIVCVDGAHAPGQIPLNLEALNPPYYVASCHKWMCAPRGVGFLCVRDDYLKEIKPVVVARSTYSRDLETGEHSRLQHMFDWFGTFDPSAYGVLPELVEWLDTLVPGGNEARMRANHDLVIRAREVVLRAVWGEELTSWTEEAKAARTLPEYMIPCMAVIPLPPSPSEEGGVVKIQQDLWERFGVEVQIYQWPKWPGRTLRFSCQGHNSLEQYVYLGECLGVLLGEERQGKRIA